MTAPAGRANPAANKEMVMRGWTGVLGVLGLVLLAAAFFGGGWTVGLFGLAALVAALGTAAARSIYRPLLTGTVQSQLDSLRWPLRSDPDPRALASLDKLKRVRQRLDGPLRTAPMSPLLAEVRAKAEELYESCVSWLQRAAQQQAAAARMATPEAKQELLRVHGELLGEVAGSVDRLGATVDQIELSVLSQASAGPDLAGIRSELDMGLEVARRVEQRMNELDPRPQERQ